MLALTRNRVSGACVTASAMRSTRPIRLSSVTLSSVTLSSVTDRFSAGWIAASGLLSMEAAAAVARQAAPAAADKAVRICSRLSPPDSRSTPTSAGREQILCLCAGINTWLLGGTWLEAPTARSERNSVCLSLESQEVIRRRCSAPAADVYALSNPLASELVLRSSALKCGKNKMGFHAVS